MRIKFWKSQTVTKNKALWIANWGKLSNIVENGENKEAEKSITDDLLQLWVANEWDTNNLTKNRRGKIVIDKVMWTALQNCNKTHVKKVLTFHSTAEPNREKSRTGTRSNNGMR